MELISFLMITFLLPAKSMVAQAMISNDFICFILYGMQAAAPTISAIAVLSSSKKGKKFLVQMFRKEHLIMAVILPVIVACVTMFLAKLIYCAASGVDFALVSIPAVQFIIILWALFAEEIGWRGYLELLLRTYGINKWVVPGIVGMIWCLWHYHYFLQNGIEVPILLFFISCVIESYIYSFFMSITGDNVVSAMTYHFAWNLLIHVAAINPADNNGSIVPYIILVLLETLVLLVFWSVRILLCKAGRIGREEIYQ